MPKAKPTAQNFTKRGTLVKLPAKTEGKVTTKVIVDHWPTETNETPQCIVVADKKHVELVKTGRVLGYVLEAKTLLLRAPTKPETKVKKKRGRKPKEEAPAPKKKKAKNGRRKKK